VSSNFLGTISGGFQTLVNTVAQTITPILAAISGTISATLASIAGSLSGVAAAIASPFVSAISAVEAAFSGLVDWVAGTARAILGFLQPVLDFISRLASSLSGLLGAAAGSGGGAAAPSEPGGLGVDTGGDFSSGDFNAGAPTLATGGHIVSGPSGTDTIPAWLSLNEFVIKADAVRHYGASLFHALNSMALPFDAFRGFSLGGFVDAIGERLAPPLMLAGGGPVLAPAGGPLVPVHLHMPGGEVFEIEVKPGQVFDKLARHARSSALRSAGRKPSWKTG
jgi:hypothetical protein